MTNPSKPSRFQQRFFAFLSVNIMVGGLLAGLAALAASWRG